MSRPLLELRGITKSFFGAPAVREASFVLRAGEVLGLIGENGAGKSTLTNILGGVLPADAGEILWEGRPFRPRSPAESAQAGVALVHQELNLFLNLSIAENLFLTGFPVRSLGPLRLIDQRAVRRQTADALAAVQLPLDPSTPVGTLSPGERQLVEIARAVRARARVVVFDEPTTSLSRPEAQRLFDIVGRLRAQGTAVVYISHNLGDVLRLCDRVVVLRDGAVQADEPATELSVSRMITLMVGRSLESFYPKRSSSPSPDKLLEVRGVSQPGILENVSFVLHRGEVLGVSGLMGSGRTELVRILFGLDPFERGQIVVKGKSLRPSPRRCIRRGVALLSEDRRGEGLLMEADIQENLLLASLSRPEFTICGMLRRSAMARQTARLVDVLNIDCRAPRRQLVRTLSGGNQQKVILAKWLSSGSEIFLLDEPTRGVDIAARCDIYRQIADLVDRGAGVLLISSEMEELVGLSDRILVMSLGEVQSVLDKRDFDRDEMLRSALGKERLQ